MFLQECRIPRMSATQAQAKLYIRAGILGIQPILVKKSENSLQTILSDKQSGYLI